MSHESRPVRPRLDALDGLRATAATLVVLYHVCLTSGLTAAGALAPVAAALKSGVTVFFVISGFLLYLPYAQAITGGAELQDWRRYVSRRFARIVPAYWVALTVLALTPFGESIRTPEWWRYYGLAQIYSPTTVLGGLGPAWTLCVEVTFYAALPIYARCLAAFVTRRPSLDAARVQLAALAALAFGTIAMRAAVSGSLTAPIAHAPAAVIALPGMLDWFAIGMALAVVVSRWALVPTYGRLLVMLAKRPAYCWLLALGCYLAGAFSQPSDLFLPLYGVFSHIAFGLAGGFLVLAGIRSDAVGVPARLLRAGPARWLGTVSYGIYLWHLIVLSAIVLLLSSLAIHLTGLAEAGVLLALVGTGAVCLGAASWYLVERPAQRLLRPRDLPTPAPALAFSQET